MRAPCPSAASQRWAPRSTTLKQYTVGSLCSSHGRSASNRYSAPSRPAGRIGTRRVSLPGSQRRYAAMRSRIGQQADRDAALAAHEPGLDRRVQQVKRAGGARGHRGGSQWPRKASSSHQDGRAETTLASMTSGRSRGPASQSRAAARSPAPRTVMPVAAVAAGDGGQVGVREHDVVERVAVRAEVVHLGAVGRVVVHGDHQRQPEAGRGAELGGRHEEAAVAQRRHCQAIRARDRGAQRGGQAQADRLVALREAEAGAVGHRQEHRRVAHEVARVDDQGALGRQEVVEPRC